MVFGSDDEKALTLAIRTVFPSCQQALCTRHLLNNTIMHLRDKVGLPTRQRSVLVDQVFGGDGLMHAPDQLTFDVKKESLEDQWPATDIRYFTKLTTQVLENVCMLNWNGSLAPGWTNNAAESTNNVFKHLVSWQSQPLPTLVERLETHIQAQQVDVSRALMGQGNYILRVEQAHMRRKPEDWMAMTAKQRGTLIKKLREPVGAGMVSSSQGGLVVNSSPCGGKKPGQRKRRRAEKTTT